MERKLVEIDQGSSLSGYKHAVICVDQKWHLRVNFCCYLDDTAGVLSTSGEYCKEHPTAWEFDGSCDCSQLPQELPAEAEAVIKRQEKYHREPEQDIVEKSVEDWAQYLNPVPGATIGDVIRAKTGRSWIIL
jgi:hypothetical protein